MATIDSLSVKTTEVDASRGFNEHKKIKAHIRHLATDTLGYPPAVKVTNTTEPDAKYAIGLLESVLFWHISIQLNITLNLKHTGFSVIAKRWVVERTFAWLNCFRRLNIDYQRFSHNAETMLYLAPICLMLKRVH